VHALTRVAPAGCEITRTEQGKRRVHGAVSSSQAALTIVNV
jgi:hypothetical protein